MFNFEKLDVYQESLKLIKDLIEVGSKFPKYEQYELSSQLRRSSTSIALNIAEGCSRTNKEKMNFLRFARGSVFEVVAILQIVKSINYINKDDYDQLYHKCEHIAKMISSLIKTL